MFKRAIFQITEPLCSCVNNAKLSWCVKNVNGNHTLMLWCETCNTQLTIPHDEFLGMIQILKPAPTQVNQKELFSLHNKDSWKIN